MTRQWQCPTGASGWLQVSYIQDYCERSNYILKSKIGLKVTPTPLQTKNILAPGFAQQSNSSILGRQWHGGHSSN